MRLNRGTIILIVAALAVIVAVLVLNGNQADAPADGTPEPLMVTAETVGPVFPDVAQDSVLRLEVTDNQTGAHTLLLKDDAGAWVIADATNRTDRAPNEAEILNQVGALAGLVANDTFESDTFADFGLDNPSYVLSMSTEDGQTYTVYVGSINPSGNRYYIAIASGDTPDDLFTVPPAMPEMTEEPEATEEPAAEATEEVTEEPDPEATPEPTPVYEGVTPGESGTIFLVLESTIGGIIDMIAAPPYVAAPTPTPTPTATLNPLSEVDQATATAGFFATSTAVIDEVIATATARAEATPEATAEP